ncbi:hypothetical protein ASPWEDRAFT_45610 [Aspergillus wentii DTO 134E9]|uniref:Uncharacterized protein n=1 Tax=Aspergillus wentii DTO 134E9 TaxID=1073089 RepID=A0A1L9R9N6_ASPWE|nr:uncharacterized protein ASPWEDRAFT_45610 [Aspergillus wentii DTO 134E9]OJJ31641.1 hypothetical protein ASPWEDRAFT_45610 [Aspergillus wentii DTO 134E9]
MLLRALKPAFILFCDVRITTDLENLAILRRVKRTLTQFTNSHPSIAKLNRLDLFIKLCMSIESESADAFEAVWKFWPIEYIRGLSRELFRSVDQDMALSLLKMEPSLEWLDMDFNGILDGMDRR